MKVLAKNIIDVLEQYAHPSLQESYDNCGLLTGDAYTKVSGVLLTLDCTEEVIDEAIKKKCNMVIAHHPVIFSGLKKLNGKNYIERTIIKAIKNNILIYAIHTNLDNVYNGVNAKIAEKLSLVNTKVLAPVSGKLLKLVTYVPVGDADNVRNAIFKAGAGVISEYDNCSFNVQGTGTFRGSENSNPHVGNKGEIHFENELSIEVILPEFLKTKVVAELKKAHPYEEVAYDIYTLENEHPRIGAGLIGELKNPIQEKNMLKRIKDKLKAKCIRHTALLNKPIQKVALCGGSGSFLLKNAIAAGADIFITADFKYHQFFDAENRIIIADIGHYESEQFTIEILRDVLIKNFPTFAVHFTEVNTNPINYYF
jgi:dinuclear metal center YbgI/SA1388 family protein